MTSPGARKKKKEQTAPTQSKEELLEIFFYTMLANVDILYDHWGFPISTNVPVSQARFNAILKMLREIMEYTKKVENKIDVVEEKEVAEQRENTEAAHETTKISRDRSDLLSWAESRSAGGSTGPGKDSTGDTRRHAAELQNRIDYWSKRYDEYMAEGNSSMGEVAQYGIQSQLTEWHRYAKENRLAGSLADYLYEEYYP